MIRRILAIFVICNCCGAADAALTVEKLSYEQTVAPLGVDAAAPRLSWVLASVRRGESQSAFQVMAASSSERLVRDQADLWDSGKVASRASQGVKYAGKPLASSQYVAWKVRVWNAEGHPSAWSPVQSWTMGVLNESDWQGKWIGFTPSPNADKSDPATLLLRRTFAVKPGLRRAVAHVCGLGHYEWRLNGKKVGENLLAPGWTNYAKTCLYDTYDVTEMLREGRNAAGLTLGNGMYNVQPGRYTKFTGSFGPLKAVGQIRLEYGDGTVEHIATDAQWKTAPGPITFSNTYGGEDYDARLEPRGWDKPGFDDTKWTPAVVTTGPGGGLKGFSCVAPPIRAIETLKPVNVTALKPGVAVYDLGQNASLMPALTVRGAAGSVVRIVPSELLKADGSVDRGSCAHGGKLSYWQYTLAGSGSETWFPKFCYQGCRYLQVECLPAEGSKELPVVESLAGVVVHSAATPVGRFECSNLLFNRIHALVRWAQRSNMVSVMTDCPHREKLGWLEEIHLNGPALRYEFDLARLFTKQMNDMADSQTAAGMIPSIAPEYIKFGGDGDGNAFRNSPEWGSAFLLVAWQQYEFTGDLELLRGHYDGMKRYVAYLGSKARNGIVDFGLGDWYDIGPKPPGRSQLTPKALTATAFYFADTEVLSKTARLLGNEADARQYAALSAQLRDAFNKAFYKPEHGSYATGSQCANAIALVMGLVEPANRAAVLEALVKDVQTRGLTAGDVGYRYLLRALTDGGRSDVVFEMNNQSEKPGYGYQLKQGATSLTEAWDAGRGSSQNHFMLGQIMEWFYTGLAGINCDATNGAGFQRSVIKPAIVGDVTWTRASYESGYGRIASSWKRDGAKLTLEVSIPVNTTATVYVPTKEAQSVTESGAPVAKAQGMQFLRMENGAAVYEVQSGRYVFGSRL